jgi:hypothetical protein
LKALIFGTAISLSLSSLFLAQIWIGSVSANLRATVPRMMVVV